MTFKYFFLIPFLFLSFTLFAQYSKKDQHDIFYVKKKYEIDRLFHRMNVNLNLSTDSKAGGISFINALPLIDIKKYLSWDINFGGKAGYWGDKINRLPGDTNVSCLGYLSIPIGTGLTFRLFNPLNITFQGGAFFGFEMKNIISRNNDATLTDENEKFKLTGGWQFSTELFVPLKSGLALTLGYNYHSLKYLPDYKFYMLGLAFGID